MELKNKEKREKRIGWGLVRVSTLAQAEVQHGSLEQQRHRIGRWLIDQSERDNITYEVARIIEEDQSGRASSLHKRQGYQEILSAITAGKIQFIVCEKLDRLSRDIVANTRLVQLANKHGVDVYEVDGGKIDLRDRGSRLSFNIKNMLAQEYSLELEEKISKKQREARVNNGKDTSTVPVLGIDSHPIKLGMYVVNKTEQAQVLDIFQKFIECGSLKETATYANKCGYKTKVRKTKETSDRDGNRVTSRTIGGDSFTSKSVRRILISPKIRGYAFFKDTWSQFSNLQDENGIVRWDYLHGPVVNEDIVNLAQVILKENEHKKKKTDNATVVYLLSGVLQKHDGKNLTGASAKGGQNFYYQEKGKGGLRIQKDPLENTVVNRVKEFLKSSGLLDEMLGQILESKDNGLPKINRHISRLKTDIKNLQKMKTGFSDALREAAISGGQDVVNLIESINCENKKVVEDIAKKGLELKELEEQRNTLTDRLQNEKIRDQLKTALQKFETENSELKKRIIQAIVPSIVVHPDNRLELKVNPLFYDSICKSGGRKFDQEKNGSSIPTVRSSIAPKPVIEITSNKITYFWRLDKGYLEQEYIKNGKSMAQIAREKGCARSTVGEALKTYSIERGSDDQVSHAFGQIPFGLRRQKGQLVPHKKELAVIDQIVALRHEGLSYGKIANHLNSNQIPTKNQVSRWDRPTVYKIAKRHDSKPSTNRINF